MNEIVPLENGAPTARRSITATMASRFGMEPDTFIATMVATVFAKGMSREEQAAFLLVADQYNLNPVTREIYAMPKKGGGIIPVVSIDGWVRMSNEHRAFDGMEFESEHDGDKLVSTTCRIFRKDRSHPIVVTEYLAECKRDTDPWKMQHRMLRHKAMIQCARYAFGFAGIYDPDEAERFAEPLASGNGRRAPSAAQPAMIVEHQPELAAVRQEPEKPAQRPVQARRAPSAAPPQPDSAEAPSAVNSEAKGPIATGYDPEKTRKAFDQAAAKATNREALNEAWVRIVEPIWDDLPDGHPDRTDLDKLYRDHARRVDDAEGGEP